MSLREPSGASKNQKAAFSKTLKNISFLRFLGPKASQESLKKPKKAPKRHPKSSKTPKKRDPKLDPKINKFWTNFEALLGSILTHFSHPKRRQKLAKLFFVFKHFFSIFIPIKSQFLNPIWTKLWGQFFPRMGQDEPKRAIRSFKEPFKNLEKP